MAKHTRDFPVSKVTLFGDWHGNLPFARTALTAAAESGSELFVHVGDFGFWREDSSESSYPDYLPELETLLASLGRTLLFIDGNHEDHGWLREFPAGEDGLREISPHLLHIPRGAAFTVDGKKFVGFGGALSIDRDFRVEGESWFEEELITPEDLDRLKLQREAAVLITHEAPEAPWLYGGLGAATTVTADGQRHLVMEARRALSPQFLFHGHHHHSYQSQIGRTAVVGLGKDSLTADPATLEANAFELDVEDLY